MSLHTDQNGHHQKYLQILNAGKGVEKRKPFCTVDGGVNWYSHSREPYVYIFKKLGIKLQYNPRVGLLGICPEYNYGFNYSNGNWKDT